MNVAILDGDPNGNNVALMVTSVASRMLRQPAGTNCPVCGRGLEWESPNGTGNPKQTRLRTAIFPTLIESANGNWPDADSVRIEAVDS